VSFRVQSTATGVKRVLRELFRTRRSRLGSRDILIA